MEGQTFVINFMFRQTPQVALVTIQEKEFDLIFYVQFTDGDWKDIFPKGRMYISLSAGLESPVLSHQKLAEELCNTAIEAIMKHLDAEQLFHHQEVLKKPAQTVQA